MVNKVAVITGGSSGAGEALTYKFSSEGFIYWRYKPKRLKCSVKYLQELVVNVNI